jgi:hypothetical protein
MNKALSGKGNPSRLPGGKQVTKEPTWVGVMRGSGERNDQNGKSASTKSVAVAENVSASARSAGVAENTSVSARSVVAASRSASARSVGAEKTVGARKEGIARNVTSIEIEAGDSTTGVMATVVKNGALKIAGRAEQ